MVVYILTVSFLPHLFYNLTLFFPRAMIKIMKNKIKGLIEAGSFDKAWSEFKKILTKEQSRCLAIAFAQDVLPIWEKAYPKDKRLSEAIFWAKVRLLTEGATPNVITAALAVNAATMDNPNIAAYDAAEATFYAVSADNADIYEIIIGYPHPEAVAKDVDNWIVYAADYAACAISFATKGNKKRIREMTQKKYLTWVWELAFGKA